MPYETFKFKMQRKKVSSNLPSNVTKHLLKSENVKPHF